MATHKLRLSSLDGQGGLDYQEGSDPVKSGTKTEHRYIYYRLYTEDGPLESYNPIYSDDIFISRISSKSIAPPRTAASLKKYLCKIEGYQIEPGKFNLYLSLGEKTPVEDSSRLALRGNSGVGASGFDPVVLTVSVKEKRAEAPDMVNVKKLDQWPEEEARRYVYYRVYDEDGESPSKTSFDDSEPCLGRIDALAVPPPHTVSSLKRCLIQAEKYVDCELQLFEEDDGETMMNDSDTIALHADTYFPGSSEDNPIALVSKRIPQPFSKKLKANAACTMANYDSNWHSTAAGEIFQSDGVVTTQKYYVNQRAYEYPCYVAINAAGKKAFLQGANTTLL